ICVIPVVGINRSSNMIPILYRFVLYTAGQSQIIDEKQGIAGLNAPKLRNILVTGILSRFIELVESLHDVVYRSRTVVGFHLDGNVSHRLSVCEGDLPAFAQSYINADRILFRRVCVLLIPDCASGKK